jgi:hypothetical protein
VKRSAGGYAIELRNVGGFAAPVDVVLTFADGTTRTLHQTIGLWQHDRRRATIAVPTTKSLRAVQLAGGIWMDAFVANDTWAAPR